MDQIFLNSRNIVESQMRLLSKFKLMRIPPVTIVMQKLRIVV
ncbi:hypothetical protein CsSME_00044477 [Camellia sinensis var. sinensis]